MVCVEHAPKRAYCIYTRTMHRYVRLTEERVLPLYSTMLTEEGVLHGGRGRGKEDEVLGGG